MALEDKVEAIKKVSKAMKKAPAEIEQERLPPNKEHFDQMLVNAEKQQQATTQAKEAEKVTQKIDSSNSVGNQPNSSSLLEEVKKLNTKVNNIGQLTPDSLRNQAKEIVAQIDNVKSQLSQAQQLKPSYHDLLRNRLTHVDDNLKIALSKAGIEYHSVAPETLNNKQLNPIERFMGYLTQGQYQLTHLEETINQLNLTKTQLTPANMLALQIKVSQVQQEIELFTSLLNKALESTKTIMNVQV